jgi:rRNA-processing protein FCF1
LDCVINELKRIQAAHKAAGKSQKAAGINRAIAVFKGMV